MVSETCDDRLYAALAAGGALVVLLLSVLIGCWRRFRRQALVTSRARLRHEVHVDRLFEEASVLEYPMCCISYVTFRDAGRLITHEEARERNLLIFYDTITDIQAAHETCIVFVSHQWKSREEPDPTGSDWSAAVLAIECLAATHQNRLEDIHVWIDYTSVPQRNRSCQLLSISSLPFYAAFSRFFLVVAPEVEVDGRTYNLETYQRWCRLEQFARIAMRGVAHIYACGGTIAAPATPMSTNIVGLARATRVMDGDFTVPADREKLVDTLCVLYLRLLTLHDALTLGTRVRHASHGLGVVVSTAVETHGRVGVRFDDGELQSLDVHALAEAPLVVLPPGAAQEAAPEAPEASLLEATRRLDWRARSRSAAARSPQRSSPQRSSRKRSSPRRSSQCSLPRAEASPSLPEGTGVPSGEAEASRSRLSEPARTGGHDSLRASLARRLAEGASLAPLARLSRASRASCARRRAPGAGGALAGGDVSAGEVSSAISCASLCESGLGPGRGPGRGPPSAESSPSAPSGGAGGAGRASGGGSGGATGGGGAAGGAAHKSPPARGRGSVGGQPNRPGAPPPSAGHAELSSSLSSFRRQYAAGVEQLSMSALVFYVRTHKARLFPEALFADYIQLIDERLHTAEPPPTLGEQPALQEVITVALSIDSEAVRAAVQLQAQARGHALRRQRLLKHASRLMRKLNSDEAAVKLQAAARGKLARKRFRGLRSRLRQAERELGAGFASISYKAEHVSLALQTLIDVAARGALQRQATPDRLALQPSRGPSGDRAATSRSDAAAQLVTTSEETPSGDRAGSSSWHPPLNRLTSAGI